MLFNSYSFLFIYLPIVFIGMLVLGRIRPVLAACWLGLASLTFYAVWDARYLLLLLGSIFGNYLAGYLIGCNRNGPREGRARAALWTAIAVNLGVLGYFKYWMFLVITANQALSATLPVPEIILPLGVSFFTFTQIAFLVDVYRGEVVEYSFPQYVLFVTYFPHLIAGPVLHHKQMMPQFADVKTCKIDYTNVAVGLSIFMLGLAKKVLIADYFAEYASRFFDAVRAGHDPRFFESWIGALTYAFQLYFDFSGYCDMAIGVSLLFNVRLPLNFNSPYKAVSIIDFWKRWHMTLSSFLRDYLYIPLGGNRQGPWRRYVNLLATMLIGGLWHGAGWTFVAWGGLHGLYLIINHGWRSLSKRLPWSVETRMERAAGGALTFIAVVVAWVFFRADRFATAWRIVAGMLGKHGVSMPKSLGHQIAAISHSMHWKLHKLYKSDGLTPLMNMSAMAYAMVGLGCVLVWFCPNLPQIFSEYRPTWDQWVDNQGAVGWIHWRPTAPWALAISALFIVCLYYMATSRVSEFLYFQF